MIRSLSTARGRPDVRRKRHESRRSGTVVALLVSGGLVAAATAATLTFRESTRTRSLARVERDVMESADELNQLMRIQRDSLQRLLGWTTRGRWALHVTRMSDSLFQVTLADHVDGPAMLSTTLYRPLTTSQR